MGNELKCRVRFGNKKSEGRALLETSEIIFRGDFRVKIPFSTIQSAKVEKGELQLRTPEGVAIFELGQAAEKWCVKILHPKTRMEKLGIKDDTEIAALGFSNEFDEFLQELSARTRLISRDSVKPDTELIFFKAETKPGLKQLSKITRRMRGATALWVVYPKGQSAIREGDVLSAGRTAGLKDVKVVGFSATHTALKFVIPISQR